MFPYTAGDASLFILTSGGSTGTAPSDHQNALSTPKIPPGNHPWHSRAVVMVTSTGHAKCVFVWLFPTIKQSEGPVASVGVEEFLTLSNFNHP